MRSLLARFGKPTFFMRILFCRAWVCVSLSLWMSCMGMSCPALHRPQTVLSSRPLQHLLVQQLQTPLQRQQGHTQQPLQPAQRAQQVGKAVTSSTGSSSST